MKKFLVILILIAAGLWALQGPLSDHLAEKALEERDYAEAFQMANLKKTMLRYDSAETLYRKIAASHPDGAFAQDCRYFIGVCLDRQRKPEEAIKALEAYLKAYPNGNWTAQARQRLSQLKANSATE